MSNFPETPGVVGTAVLTGNDVQPQYYVFRRSTPTFLFVKLCNQKVSMNTDVTDVTDFDLDHLIHSDVE